MKWNSWDSSGDLIVMDRKRDVSIIYFILITVIYIFESM